MDVENFPIDFCGLPIDSILTKKIIWTLYGRILKMAQAV